MYARTHLDPVGGGEVLPPHADLCGLAPQQDQVVQALLQLLPKREKKEEKGTQRGFMAK